MKHTCEHCKWWRAMIVGFGKVKPVCWCEQSVEHYMMETGAAATCERWEAVVEVSRPARRRGRRKVDKVPDSSAGEKIKKEPWRKVRCSICGEVTGAIRKGDGVGRLYPSRHKDSSTGERCRGVDQPAMVATD